LEKKLTSKAESQVAVAQDDRVGTETAPSEEEGIAEGSVEHQGSPEAGEDGLQSCRLSLMPENSQAALLLSVLGERLVNSLRILESGLNAAKISN